MVFASHRIAYGYGVDDDFGCVTKVWVRIINNSSTGSYSRKHIMSENDE
jgi:hypothetical protein